MTIHPGGGVGEREEARRGVSERHTFNTHTHTYTHTHTHRVRVLSRVSE